MLRKVLGGNEIDFRSSYLILILGYKILVTVASQSHHCFLSHSINVALRKQNRQFPISSPSSQFTIISNKFEEKHESESDIRTMKLKLLKVFCHRKKRKI